MIFYRKKGVSLAEIWYDDTEKPEYPVDVIKYRFVPNRIKGSSSVEELYTILIDLSRDTDDLWADMDKTTKYQINKCMKSDPVETYTFLPCGEENKKKLQEYIDFFNIFASSKGRGLIDYSDLAPFYETGTLEIRGAREKETSQPLTMHANVVGGSRARLHQSCSHFRNESEAEYVNMIGRSNRLLHWEDLLFYKTAGIAFYDFGGWYGGSEDTAKLSINRFKEGFGGEKTPEFTCIKAYSFKGRLSCAVRNILKRK